MTGCEVTLAAHRRLVATTSFGGFAEFDNTDPFYSSFGLIYGVGASTHPTDY